MKHQHPFSPDVTADEFRSRKSQAGYLKAIKIERHQVVTTPDFGSSENFLKEENKGKNRYEDIPCWDRTRVTVTPGKDNSDYIHANYVDSFGSPKKFIATQGPLKETIEEFWQMAWDQKSYIILMLTKLRVSEVEKCVPYWRDDKEYTLFTRTGKFLISMITGWPDFKTPTNSLSFIKLVLAVNLERQRPLREAVNGPVPGPIIVHCSTGNGRTGTFCSVDSCLYQLVKTETVSVPGTVMKIRSQRHTSVLAPEQYVCINSVLHYFLQMCDQYPNLRDEISAHKVQSMNGSDFLSFMDQPDVLARINEEYRSIISMDQKEFKNAGCLPFARCLQRQVKLSSNEKIHNASFVDGYHTKRKYI
ncbi:hypothetical protein PR048_017770 [Dryococelus australis]|uniref:Protein tyrosine phosphatase n=1 Tax=Dryococelus australis TaxID=614101 RepID=A0ABQ9HAM4_9NEOP|nr:hypothetical protein PR048_017770 [Dryococelus australis]